jgi:CheY-like chemotaxis protein
VDGENVLLHFTVADSGVGIAANACKMIFDPFTQADSSTTRTFGGTGLGLAITARLVKMMGGDIWVESELGRGSEFHFTAHLGIGHVAEDAAVKTVAAAAPWNGSPLRVLLVEDNGVNRLVVTRLLEKQGHQVEAATTGREALAALSRAHYDVVLMDVQMPDMDGFETTRMIRTMEKQTGRHQQIVALTAHAMIGDRERCLEAGMDAYLTKPISAPELYRLLEGCSQGAGSQRAPQGPTESA